MTASNMAFSNYTFDPSKYTPFVVTSKPMTDDWRRWIAENKLLGTPDESIIATLVQHGIDKHIANQELQIAISHPYFQAGSNLTQALTKLESHLDVYVKLAQLSQKSQQIDRRDNLSNEEFLEDYYAKNTPVILTGVTRNWAALSLWTPDYLRSKYGNVEVEVQADRNSDRLYELNVDSHRKKVLMNDYVDAISNGNATNDYYMVANNGNLSKTELRSLLDDIEFPEYLDGTDTDDKVFFWLGPAGTVTPLHHDPTNLIFAQIYGRKTWKIIPPYYTHLLYNYTGVFSEVDYENPDYKRYPLFRDIPTLEVTLEPGDAIFMPVGWWHHVKSLDVSISMSFTNFVFPNQFAWNYPNIAR
jgi:ribosomal protein L16 Arg81 hydroxylase